MLRQARQGGDDHRRNVSDTHRLDDEAAIAEIRQAGEHPAVITQDRCQQRNRLIGAALAAFNNRSACHTHVDARLALDDTAERPARERRKGRCQKRTGLLDEARSMNGVVENDQHAKATRIGRQSDDRAGEQIGRSVGARCFSAAHRAGDDNRLVAADQAIEHERGLFEGVCPLNDDGTCNVAGQPLVQKTRYVTQVRQRQRRPRQAKRRDRLDLRHMAECWHSGHEVRTSQRRHNAGTGACGHGDRPTQRDQQ